MNKLAAAIADFNEEHGITAVQVDGKTITNDQLRNLPKLDAHQWVEANIGRTFRRPHGKVVYTVRDVEVVYLGYMTIVEAICDTENGERRVSWHQLNKMERVS